MKVVIFVFFFIINLVIWNGLLFCGLTRAKEEKNMPERKKAVFIIAHEKFRDEEFAQPRKILEEKGAKHKLVSKRRIRRIPPNVFDSKSFA